LLKKFKKILLVAPAIDDSDIELLGCFKPDLKFTNLNKYQNKIVVFASKDDFIVPFKQIKILQEKLPNINYKIFENK
jgi:predicted alpha/beta hydrolase family esterase